MEPTESGAPTVGPERETLAGGPAYLLTWNPAAWPFASLQATVAAVRDGRPPEDEAARRWSCGNNRGIKKGARLFLAKQGAPPRGVVGSAWATSDVKDGPHWDPDRAARGDQARFVELQFDTLIDPAVTPPLAPEDLSADLAAGIHWATASSGIGIDRALAPKLEEAWRAYLASLEPAAPPSAAADFLDVLRRYQAERTVFQSPSLGHRYAVRAVTDDRCEVHRVDASEPATCTVAWYEDKARLVRDAGGSVALSDLDGTVAKRIAFAQSARFGLSADRRRVLDLADPAKALDNFCAILRELDVNRSSGAPKLYKPILAAAVIEGVEAGELPSNRVAFDWLVPRFLARAAALGVEASDEQAAMAFYHLTSDQFWMLCYTDLAQLIDPGAVSPGAIRQRVSHATVKDTYWRLLQVPAFRARALRTLRDEWWPTAEPAPDARSSGFWWVNQGQTYAEERRLGIIWAPQRNEQGAARFHWTNVSRVRAGDVVFSYADGAIRSVSIARSDGQVASKPQELAGHSWANDGWKAELAYHDLPSPIPLTAVGDKLARLNLPRRGPVNAAGGVNQAYLFELTTPAARVIAAELDVPELPTPVAERLRALLAGVPRYWAMSLGRDGKYWEECYHQGLAVVGGDELQDFREYRTKEDFSRAISRAWADEARDPVNDALMCYQFAYEMRPGDYVIAKSGRETVLGIGVVVSDYFRDDARTSYKNARRVRWLARGPVTLSPEYRLPIKTLTDVSESTATIEYIKEHLPWEGPMPVYTVDQALDGLFVPREEFESLLAAWRRKKNAILQGPPGVGKTFVAKRLAYALMGTVDPPRVEMVQFHQSYAYEDFVQGWRPNEEGGFTLKDGLFYDFCRRAARDAARRPHVFIIDEINRGNLSRIFGELMFLIEPDHRGEAFAIPLTYSKDASDRFCVPENVYLLGMMNTADRSLAMVDYALRRRFCFAQLRPAFASPEFRAFLAGRVEGPLIDRVVARMTALNERVAQDKNLGRGFEIGHSFFCPANGEAGLDGSWYEAVVHREIAPLVREYWFDDLDKADELIADLRR